MLSEKRKRQINRFTTSLRYRLGLDSFPVDVAALVEGLGGTLVFIEELELGIYACVKKREVPFLFDLLVKGKEEQLLPWQRLLIAHNIGHMFLHFGFLVDKDLWDKIDTLILQDKYQLGYSYQEHEADEFAYGLLMPKHEYASFITYNKNDIAHISVTQLAKHFGVPEKAVVGRGRDINFLD